MENTVSSLSSPTLLADPHKDDSETSDAHLLGEFVSDQDEAAFAALVKRHGGLVRGVCRRILSDPATADDAFQQTFLSLSQHASLLLRTVAPTASLGSWLYRVAVNASLQLKRKARSRRRTETQFAEHRPSSSAPSEPWNEVLPALDEEISALPGQYRSAVVKCHLEGKTQQDAAKELGITYATLRRRLKEARGMLRNRLSERGFVKNGFLLVPLLGQLVASEAVSAQTATTVTETVLSSGAVSVTAAGSTAAASTAVAGSGGTLAIKLLAANPLVKAVLAGVLMFSAIGGWWMSRSDSAPEEPNQTALSEADAAGTEEQNQSAKPAEESLEEQNHFAYIFHNGQPLSPEFENAVKALDDTDPRRRDKHADVLHLPELKKSRKILDGLNVEAPLPPDVQLLTGSAPEGLIEKVNNPEFAGPIEKLLIPSPPANPQPLPVQEIMEILNEQQERRSSPAGFGRGMPSIPEFFGHHTSQPAKTLKVIPLP
jgi:RNA polymerase sigma factor (sigma-70 family)